MCTRSVHRMRAAGPLYEYDEMRLLRAQAAEAARERERDAAEAARLLLEQGRLRARFQAEQAAEAVRKAAGELRASGGATAAQARRCGTAGRDCPCTHLASPRRLLGEHADTWAW